jgi:predicted ATP-binding protein involved in virulence
MKVKRLELKGFRGFDEIVLDFDTSPQRPTVFIGVNGVGKSSVLDSLVILLSWFIKRIEFDPDSKKPLQSETEHRSLPESQFAYGYPFEDIKNNCDNASGKILIDYQSEEIKWTISTVFQLHNYVEDTNTNHTINMSSEEVEELNILTKKIRDATRKNSYESLPIIIYYSVNRSSSQIPLISQDIVSTTAIDAYKNALDRKSIDSKEFFQWYRNTEDLENERIRDDANYKDKQLVAVRDAIHSLIPEFDNLRIRRSPPRMTVNKTIGDKVEELSIDQLSDGEKCLLAMVGDIARRLAIANPSLDDPLQGEGIVLIDEIELHLHPQWQHKIIPRLTETFPNCQFIVTTHSPQVLSHVQPENIYILQSTPDGIIASNPESSYGRDSNQILEDYMGTPERPQDIKDKILELFRLIDRNDFAGAKQLCQSIGSEIGFDEPELLRAGVVIKRKEILGK